MTRRDLERIYEYGDWANGRLFEVISRLTAEEFVRPVAGSYGSVRNTMVHILSAEWGWLARCGGPERGGRLKPEDYPTLEAVKRLSEEVRGYARQRLSSLEDRDLSHEIEYVLDGNVEGRKQQGDLLHHAAVHAIHHRGQVALLLRVLGHAPGNFDLLFYPDP